MNKEKSARDVVLVEGVRTAFAKSGTALKNVSAVELGRMALKELVQKVNLDANEVDDVVVGSTWNPTDAVNVARVIALNAGLPVSVPASTVNRFCASSLDSISQGCNKIGSGLADVVVAGGTESMSNMPWLMNREVMELLEEFLRAKRIWRRLEVLKKLKLKHIKPRVSVEVGLIDPVIGMSMGQTAEVLAKEFEITRAEQDNFALESHERAVRAQQSGRFEKEIVPVFVPPDYKMIIEKDVGPRVDETLELLEALTPVFDQEFGTVTAGNACSITDGAAMVLLMSREKADSLGYKPLARVLSHAFVGVDPSRMGLGPVHSTPLVLKRTGLKLSDMGLVELNEAFAAQILACQKAFASREFAKSQLGLDEAIGDLDPDILNVNGGAMALGHPVGASGARLALTIAKEMQIRNVQYGLVTLSAGGGQGGSMILEVES